MDEELEYFDTAQLARLTHTRPQTWRRKRWQGDGPAYVKLGTRVLYSRAEIERYFAARTFRSTSEATPPPEQREKAV
jgi:hypothetical protein